MGAVVVAVFWSIGTFWGRSSSTRRITNATGVWLATLMAGIALGTLGAQRGLADAHDVGKVGGTLALSLLAASVLGVLTALITPGDITFPATGRLRARRSVRSGSGRP